MLERKNWRKIWYKNDLCELSWTGVICEKLFTCKQKEKNRNNLYWNIFKQKYLSLYNQLKID